MGTLRQLFDAVPDDAMDHYAARLRAGPAETDVDLQPEATEAEARREDRITNLLS